MNKKTLLTLLGVLVILVLLSQLTSQRRYATSTGGGFVELVDGFDRGNVDVIRAWIGSSPDSSLTLERNGSSWLVASAHGWPAKESTMNGLFDKLDELKGEKRSSTDDVLADYELDDEAGLHLVAEGGGSELFHLIVGKSVRGSNNFVRHAGSTDAFASNRNLRGTFGIWGENPKPPAQSSWIDLKLLEIDPNDVDKLELTSDGNTVVLEKVFEMIDPDSAQAAEGATPTPDRNNWTWKPDGRGNIVKSKADGILNSFRTLSAADVAHPDSIEAFGLGDGARTAAVTLQDGTTHTIAFGEVSAADENRVYVRIGDGRPAQMWKGTVDRVFAERSSLSPDPE